MDDLSGCCDLNNNLNFVSTGSQIRLPKSINIVLFVLSVAVIRKQQHMLFPLSLTRNMTRTVGN